jgi:hypothetical protein
VKHRKQQRSITTEQRRPEQEKNSPTPKTNRTHTSREGNARAQTPNTKNEQTHTSKNTKHPSPPENEPSEKKTPSKPTLPEKEHQEPHTKRESGPDLQNTTCKHKKTSHTSAHPRRRTPCYPPGKHDGKVVTTGDERRRVTVVRR